jgi:hypothetical protein
MRKNTFFAKLNAVDQIKRLNRTVDKSTIEWWGKQCQNARNKSFKPLPTDTITEDALVALANASFGTKLASQLKPIIIPPLDKEETFKNECPQSTY